MWACLLGAIKTVLTEGGIGWRSTGLTGLLGGGVGIWWTREQDKGCRQINSYGNLTVSVKSYNAIQEEIENVYNQSGYKDSRSVGN